MAEKKRGLWGEGKYVDLWSLVHFLGGFAIGAFLVYFNVEPYIASAIGVALFVGREIFEHLAKIHEHGANRLGDLVFDYAGFFIAQLYVFAWGGTMHLSIPLTVGVVTLALEAWGFSDFLKRKRS